MFGDIKIKNIVSVKIQEMCKKGFKLSAFLVMLIFAFYNCFAGSFEDSNDSIALGNFIGFVIKTAEVKKPGVTCVFGNDAIAKTIIEQSKDFIDLNISPKKYSSCRAIYVAKSEEGKSRLEMTNFSREGILTIATFDGFVETGGVIQAQIGRRSFELIVNLKQIKAFSIRLSPLAMDLVINN